MFPDFKVDYAFVAGHLFIEALHCIFYINRSIGNIYDRIKEIAVETEVNLDDIIRFGFQKISYLRKIYILSVGLNIEWYYTGQERFGIIAFRNISSKIIMLALVFLLVIAAVMIVGLK